LIVEDDQGEQDDATERELEARIIEADRSVVEAVAVAIDVVIVGLIGWEDAAEVPDVDVPGPRE